MSISLNNDTYDTSIHDTRPHIHTSFAIQSALHATTYWNFIHSCIRDVINRVFVLTRFWDIDWRSWMETRSRQRPTNSIIQSSLLFIYVYIALARVFPLWHADPNSVIYRIIAKNYFRYISKYIRDGIVDQYWIFINPTILEQFRNTILRRRKAGQFESNNAAKMYPRKWVNTLFRPTKTGTTTRWYPKLIMPRKNF